MNWLAKININTMIKHFGLYRSALLLLFIMLSCLFFGYRLGNFYHGYQTKTLADQNARLDKLYQIQTEQVSRIHNLEVELAVERLANKKAQNVVKSVEKAHFQAKQELAFYENVMAPEKKADGLTLDSFNIFASESENLYRFQMVLVQQKQKRSGVSGYIEMTLEGSQDKKPVTLSLNKISALKKEDLSFGFKYFQMLEGEFTLPKGFVAEKVNVATVLPKNRWQKYYRLDNSYQFDELVKK